VLLVKVTVAKALFMPESNACNVFSFFFIFVQLCITTWKLLETALCKPHWHVVHNLVLRNLLSYSVADLQSSRDETEFGELDDHSRVAVPCQMRSINQVDTTAASFFQPGVTVESLARSTSLDSLFSDSVDPGSSSSTHSVNQPVDHANMNNNSVADESLAGSYSVNTLTFGDQFCTMNKFCNKECVVRKTSAVTARSTLAFNELQLSSGSPNMMADDNETVSDSAGANANCAVHDDTCVDDSDTNDASSLEAGCEGSVQQIVNLLVSKDLILLNFHTITVGNKSDQSD
jgi:hypothetical protein